MIADYKFTFSEEVRRYAEETLGETEEARKEGLEEIRRWLGENPKLNGCLETTAILPFLRGCKFDVEKAKKKLANYYKMKAEAPEWFSNRDPLLPEMEKLIRMGVVVPLKQIRDNRIVIIVRLHACDYGKYHLNDLIKVCKMLLDLVGLENEILSIFGLAVVVDLREVNFALVKQLSLSIIRKTAQMLLNDPWRISSLEFLNVPFYIHFAIGIFKTFLSNKLKNRININADLESLHKRINKEILPVEYGGDNGEIEGFSQHWLDKMIQHRNWFENDEKYKAELS